jgi:MFS family permease
MGSFVAVFLVLYLTEMGYSPSQAGLMLTAFGVASIAGSFAAGSVVGRFGTRQAIVASMLLSSVATAALGLVDGYVSLLLVCVAAGAFNQVYRPAAATMMAELTPPKRLVMTSAATRLGLNVGASVGPLVGVWLSTYSYTAVFLANAATNLGFALVAQMSLPNNNKQQASKASGTKTSGGDGRYVEVLRDRRFLLVIVAMFLTAVTEAQYQAVLPLEIRDRGLSTALYGTVLALNGALVIVFELPLTRFTQKLPMRNMIAFGSLLTGGGLALFGFPAGIWIFFAGTVVWTLGEIIGSPAIVAYPALAAPREQLRSRYIGALSTAQIAGYAIGASVGTTLFQYSSTAVWVMCAMLGLIAFVGMWIGASRSPRHAATPAPGDADITTTG